MKATRFLLGALLLLLCGTVLQAQPSLVPKPAQATWGKGKFTIQPQTTIAYGDKALQPAADYLASSLQRLTGVRPKTQRGGKGDILLQIDRKGVKGEGAYRLNVEKARITVKGHDYGAITSAIATLRQITEGKEVATCQISDAPRFGWRGFHLDCSRHFFSVAEVEEAIDLMALYKLNRFHWHLTDDQGWRIEIKKYPLLTERGAWRKPNGQDASCLYQAKKEDNPDLLLPSDRWRTTAEGDSLYGGFYTQDQIREVVSYAAARGISIVPEIDMPGHCLSAIANYEGLSCFDQVGWGKVFTSPLCPGKDAALEFCRNVWSEVIALFPYEYVHIGGDEVEKDNWRKCADCQRRIAQQGLKGVEELQSWFIHEMERFFNAKGRRMIGWDEIIEGGLSKTSTVMWWRNWAPSRCPRPRLMATMSSTRRPHRSISHKTRRRVPCARSMTTILPRPVSRQHNGRISSACRPTSGPKASRHDPECSTCTSRASWRSPNWPGRSPRRRTTTTSTVACASSSRCSTAWACPTASPRSTVSTTSTPSRTRAR